MEALVAGEEALVAGKWGALTPTLVVTTLQIRTESLSLPGYVLIL